MDGFLPQWTAHRRDLVTAWELKYHRFIMIGVDDSKTAASGCSIDALLNHLRQFEHREQIEILNSAAKVFYLEADDRIACVTRPEFKRLVAAQVVGANTIVFNNVVQTVGELRAGKWQVAMNDSWHAQAFSVSC